MVLILASILIFRVPCEYKNKNLAVRVEEPSRKDYLQIKFLYQGGQTEIVAVDVAQVSITDHGMGIDQKFKNYASCIKLFTLDSFKLEFQLSIINI